MRGFTDGRVLAALALVAWSCAKANDSNLAGGVVPFAGGSAGVGAHGGTGGSVSTGGSGATSGKPGTSASGGTTSSGGSGGATSSGGSTNAFGGSNATGGSDATGGSTSTGGTSSTGGSNATGGSTSTGGSNATGGSSSATGGTGGLPDLSDAEVVLDYINYNTPDASSKSISMRLFLDNKGTKTLDMRAVTVRYWLTAETNFSLKSYFQGDDLNGFVSLSFVDADDSYIETKFSGGAIPPGESLYKTEFQIKADAMSNLDQSNDWSFSPVPTADPAQPNEKITVYVSGKLVWGCEPSGACPGGNGEGGAGGQGGEAGQGGQPEQGGTAGTSVAGAGATAGIGGTAGAGGTAGIGGTAGTGGTAEIGGTSGTSGTAGAGGTAGTGVVTAGTAGDASVGGLAGTSS